MIDVFYFDGKVKKATFSPAVIKDLLGRKKMWIDITDPKKEEVETLKGLFQLHPITAEDILIENTRVKIEEFSTYIYLVLYGIVKQKNIRLIEIDFVLGKNFLITTHKTPIQSFERLKGEQQKLQSLFKQGPDFIMHKLIDREVDNFVPVLELFDDVIEKIEGTIVRNPRPEMLHKILDLKRRISHIKKILIPQQEKISFLAKNKYALISPACQTYFRDVHDHFYSVTDIVEGYRDTLSGAFDAYMSSISNTTNEVLKVLSVMATIMLPLSVMSGVYGMNLLLPGAESPFAFWLMVGAMLLLIIIMVSFFKKKGWI